MYGVPCASVRFELLFPRCDTPQGASRYGAAMQVKMTRDLFSLVSALSGVTRFSMLKMCHRENVLEHTGMMVCFCYVLGSRLNAAALQTNKGIAFNMAILLSKATVHDWDETITGDVARPTKYFNSKLRNELRDLEIAGVDAISQRLAMPVALDHHIEAKDGPEGTLVALCDIACAIHRCWEEVLVYNNMHFVLPAPRLVRVLQKKLREMELELMSAEQWNIINNFAMDLHNILQKIIQHGNGELHEMAHAD